MASFFVPVIKFSQLAYRLRDSIIFMPMF